jgi:hypothetical protein
MYWLTENIAEALKVSIKMIGAEGAANIVK